MHAAWKQGCAYGQMDNNRIYRIDGHRDAETNGWMDRQVRYLAFIWVGSWYLEPLMNAGIDEWMGGLDRRTDLDDTLDGW